MFEKEAPFVEKEYGWNSLNTVLDSPIPIFIRVDLGHDKLASKSVGDFL